MVDVNPQVVNPSPLLIIIAGRLTTTTPRIPNHKASTQAQKPQDSTDLQDWVSRGLWMQVLRVNGVGCAVEI